MLYTSHIRSALCSNASTCKSFLNVFPSDKLPLRLNKYPASLVVNTDPHDKPGMHWVAFYFDEDQQLDYFDSYGTRPEKYPDLSRFAYANSSLVTYNNCQLQGDFSDVCGHYCIAFIGLRSKGRSLDEIVNYYSPNNCQTEPGTYDEFVRKQVTKEYSFNSPGCSDGKCEQRCCSKKL